MPNRTILSELGAFVKRDIGQRQISEYIHREIVHGLWIVTQPIKGRGADHGGVVGAEGKRWDI